MKFLIKIVTFVTKNKPSRKIGISKYGNPGGKRTSRMHQALQKMVADAEETRNGAWGGVLKIEILLLKIAQKF